MHYLVLNIHGVRNNKLISELAKQIKNCRCNIIDSHIQVMGNFFAGMMLLGGKWDAIAKIEDMIPKLEKTYQMQTIVHRTHLVDTTSKLVPYAIDIVFPDQAGILYEVANFITHSGLMIQEINTRRYKTWQTNTDMTSLHILVNIPTNLSIAGIRGDFIDFCDQLNIDAVMEPVK